jgi:hypothetical protein
MGKSSRHSKIAGNFGEALILYWLSKNNFECASIDHTGIDIIARNPHTQELMGISVKSRTRVSGTEYGTVTVEGNEFPKMDEACKAFKCEPYFAVVVDAKDVIRVFILSKANFLKYSPTKKHSYWKMTTSALETYAKNEEIITFELSCKITRWWKNL